MKYKVTKSFGKYTVGDLLDGDDFKEGRIARRKIAEGGCIKPVGNQTQPPKQKMEKTNYENKMEKPGGNK